MLSLLAPGQGSQTPGMLTEWLELPGARDRVSAWSEAIGLDLERLGTTATAEEITDTAVTQPLVVLLGKVVSHGAAPGPARQRPGRPDRPDAAHGPQAESPTAQEPRADKPLCQSSRD